MKRAVLIALLGLSDVQALKLEQKETFPLPRNKIQLPQAIVQVSSEAQAEADAEWGPLPGFSLAQATAMTSSQIRAQAEAAIELDAADDHLDHQREYAEISEAARDVVEMAEELDPEDNDVTNNEAPAQNQTRAIQMPMSIV